MFWANTYNVFAGLYTHINTKSCLICNCSCSDRYKNFIYFGIISSKKFQSIISTMKPISPSWFPSLVGTVPKHTVLFSVPSEIKSHFSGSVPIVSMASLSSPSQKTLHYFHILTNQKENFHNHQDKYLLPFLLFHKSAL